MHLKDLERTSDGILIHIRRSKTDQEGAGHVVAVPRGSRLRPIEALDDWLEAAGIADGPVFRPVAKGGRVQPVPLTPQSVALVVKRWARAAKLDPDSSPGTASGPGSSRARSKPVPISFA
jgi:hypothetical protein